MYTPDALSNAVDPASDYTHKDAVEFQAYVDMIIKNVPVVAEMMKMMHVETEQDKVLSQII